MKIFNKKKFSKSIIYFFTEIIIVTIGIYIAVQLNNWNQTINNKKDEITSLKRIKTDLGIEKTIINNSLKDLQKSESYLDRILLKQEKNNLDSMFVHLSKTFTHYPYNSEYINLKYSGKINLISNDTLRHQLVLFYEGYYGYYNEVSLNHKDFVQNYIDKYYLNEFENDTTGLVDSRIVNQKLKDRRLKNLLVKQKNNLKNIRENIHTIIIDTLVSNINKELK